MSVNPESPPVEDGPQDSFSELPRLRRLLYRISRPFIGKRVLSITTLPEEGQFAHLFWMWPDGINQTLHTGIVSDGRIHCHSQPPHEIFTFQFDEIGLN